jgi:hypothetical protein
MGARVAREALPGGGKAGYADSLIEEEEGLNNHNVVIKCAERITMPKRGGELGFSKNQH